MDDYETLSHTKWECKYHVVFIPKCRRKVLYGELRRHIGELLRTLTKQKESLIEEGHLMPDHHFWARGYFVSTVGRDEVAIREYIRHQEAEDRRVDQLRLW